MLWEFGNHAADGGLDGAWSALGTAHLVAEEDLVTLFEFSDDPTLLDELDGIPPDMDDLREGETWEEWDDNPDV